MDLEDLALIALTMLIGDEGGFWLFYETDLDWWELRLWTRRN